jgi:hypothetical protein
MACFGQTPAPQRKTAPKTVAPKPETPFGLKADKLGESIEEFRANNDRVINLGLMGQDHLELDADLPKTKHFPQCTDDAGDEQFLSWDVRSSALTEEEARAKSIRCVAAPSGDDDPDFLGVSPPTVAEVEAYRTVYYFFQGKLYLIRSTLPKESYRTIRSAFEEKYGVPTSHVEQYQNSFGATFTGENLLWSNEISRISITEHGSDPDSQIVSESKDIETKIRSTKASTLAIGKGYELTRTAHVYGQVIQEMRDRNRTALQATTVVISIWHVGLKAQFEAAGASKTRGKDL